MSEGVSSSASPGAPSGEPSVEPAGEPGLKRTLGPVMLWGLGVGYVISGELYALEGLRPSPARE